MAKIVINDMERNDELDREVMRTITGGYNPFGITNQTVPHSFSPPKTTLTGLAHPAFTFGSSDASEPSNEEDWKVNDTFSVRG